ncbi:MAG TPA: chemotaxis protein CheA [Thermodesulfovibrio thiophilus]|mgnify:CR=1 FL=1|uniref:chemotaxis protein CheA n=1 Tax=Thermodesulfovibrio thiophilus TaxID=340095 RepID=UPI00042A82AC|nr:chemotaxis protein CheA [Thermodesulfovibrio thiophilus]HHW20795.1 chemotaxis protein CheA [Thermodesulfovibrio thiophilus]HQD36638.1 chemotaxis protein CheA [Thermodesulfovibrio thiophilus]
MADEMDEIINEFIVEAEEILEQLDPLFVELEQKGQDPEIINEIFRGMHTLKGAAGFLGFQDVVDVAHRAETILKKVREGEIHISPEITDAILKATDTLRLLISHIKAKDEVLENIQPVLELLDKTLEKSSSEQLKEAEQPETEQKPEEPLSEEPETKIPKAEDIVTQIPKEKEKEVSTLRVDVERIDKVMDLAGEIVLARNRLLNLSNKLEAKYAGDEHVEGLIETTSFLDRVTSDLQLAVMKMRMQPLQKVFVKFPRMVRDLARALNKEVDLEIIGEDTEVDKSVIEHIGDPLVHIIRNSLDHGIETPEERELKGKSPKGKIVINAYQKGTQIVIDITDDGKGIDYEAVKAKAITKGLITLEEAEKMSEEAIINLIFLPGFSTKDVSTEVSGRGVGMDVVKSNVAKLNGYVEIFTEKDKGTTFRISLPLTLAIIQAMMVQVGNEIYAIPQSMIEETLRISINDIKEVTGQKVLTIRDRVLPLFLLNDILGAPDNADNDRKYVLVASVGDRKFCISVESVLGQEEIVIKTINGIDSEECGIMGATITGDGKVVLILDLAGLSRRVLTIK